jgi:hypothetical protein
MRLLKEERSLGELFGELSGEISTLVRQEMELAKAEMGEKTSRLGRDAGFLAAGGAIAYAGYLAILAGVIVALAEAGLPWWASALLVGVVVAVLGYFLVRSGLNGLKENDLTPRQTIETLREVGNGRRTR